MSTNKSTPKNWILTRLSEILINFESGKRPKGGVRNIKSGVPSIGGEHITSNGKFNFNEIKYIPLEFYKSMTKGKIKKKDILVVKDGATTGKTSFVSENFPFKEAAVNEHVFILRTFEEFIEPKYLFYWMLSPFGQNCVKENFQGTAQGGINTLFVKNSIIPLPPLSEQYRIVAKIEELFTKLDAGIEALKKAKEQIKRYRQAVLKYAFEGKLTEEWRRQNKDRLEPASVLLEKIKKERKEKLGKKYKELPPVDPSELPELPEDWMWVRLGEIIEKIPITGKKLKKGQYQEKGEIPVIDQGQNFIGGYTDRDDLRITCKPVIVFGDHTKIVKYVDFDFVAGADGVKIMRPLEAFYPKLFYYFLQAIQLPEKGYARHFQFLEKSYIPLPPLPEQHKIVEEIERRFSVVDEVEKVIENSLKQAERLRQSILKKAFEGKLVPQDPSDEPAEKLLERIKQTKKKLENCASENRKFKKK